MLYSYNWLKELSATKKSPQEIADLLITHSFEVEEVRALSEGLKDVVIGHVLTVESHPDADRLRVAVVDIGTEKLQIVCGAPNLAQGQKVPVAIVGANLPGDFAIKKSKIRGVESNGMICAQDELGIGSDHDGIIVLPEDAPIGEHFSVYEKLDDTLLDIDVLPNRGHDAVSHRGMAREIAVLEDRIIAFDVELEMPQQSKGTIPITISTPGCTRYSATVVRDVKIAPSPQWLQQRLRSLGHSPINNVVDITNYVMLETGQPIHAFSSAFARKIEVRQAKEGEKMMLLDDSEITLSENDTVITDGANPIALAGVMGGKGSAITANTTEVTVEVAHFDAAATRASKSRHGLNTDAAYRYERDIDPNLVADARALACKLLTEIVGATLVGTADLYPEQNRVVPWSIALAHSEVMRLLGTEIDHANVRSILARLEIDVKQESDVYLCHIPTYRRDLKIPEDLIEEIGRIYGYDKIAPRPLKENVIAPEANHLRSFEDKTRDIFVAGGFDEIKSYSYYAKSEAEIIGLSGEHITLVNPMSSEQESMRRSLLVGIIKASAKNQSYTSASSLLEIGRIYNPEQEAKLPQEKLMTGLAITSKATDGEQFYALKGSLEHYMETLGVRDFYFTDDVPRDLSDALIFHPSRRAFIRLHDGEVCGVMGEIPGRIAKHFGVKNMRVAYAELDIEILRDAAQSENDFIPLAKFPPVTRDLSMIVGGKTRVADVDRVLSASGGEFLVDVDLFDLYEDRESQQRSMAFHLTFLSREKTLTAKEIEVSVAQMIEAVEEIEGVSVKKS